MTTPSTATVSTSSAQATVTASSKRGHRSGGTGQKEKRGLPSIVPGLLLAVLIALIALDLGGRLPILGAPVAGILLGMVLRNSIGVAPIFRPGLQFSSRTVLRWSIIGLGFGLSLQQVARTGMDSLVVMLVTITGALLSAWLLGKWLGIPSRLKTLIGVGTAICGGSAIAAVTPIIKAEEHETGFAISTIFLFDVIGVLTFPALGYWMGMSDAVFGTWAGTAINDTASVVAAGYSFSDTAGDVGTVVKLTRATMIIPICLGLVGWQIWHNKKAGHTHVNLRQIFPWFILWFVVASGIRSTGLIPEFMDEPLRFAAKFLMVIALTAIGLSSDLRRMRHVGLRPVLLGLGVWMSVIFSSLGVLVLMGVW